ncbi:PRA1 family protein A1-like isoform X2 [Zingiber officinale]|uniref:PRA1 family protein A1-like isoform X2 n=1 Tax=Zingiber officinale TaxID=94328 RepID=UPI001C4AAF70|nr:PRA1 family protein A1-like isoform X2 [Zingiber officinale]
MDWRSVTAEDLFNALREVEWSSPSRSILEFFSRFTVLRSYSKWSNRLKCNLYYYRTNYFILIFFVLAVGFLLKPLDVVAAFLTGLSNAFLNDRRKKSTLSVSNLWLPIKKMQAPIKKILAMPNGKRLDGETRPIRAWFPQCYNKFIREALDPSFEIIIVDQIVSAIA